MATCDQKHLEIFPNATNAKNSCNLISLILAIIIDIKDVILRM